MDKIVSKNFGEKSSIFRKKSKKFRHFADFSASGDHARRSASRGDFFADFSAIN